MALIVVIYANDTLGNMEKSETIFFNVNFAQITVLCGIVVIVIAIGTGLLVYFKKRKHSENVSVRLSDRQ
jgi:hypothetical protein